MSASALRVLLVEDEDDTLALLAELLTDEGCDVSAHRTGEAALAAVLVRPPDVAIVDLRLPDVDGLNIVRELRRTAPHARIIVVTGVATHAAQESAIAEGADAFLAKPVKYSAIAAQLGLSERSR